MKSSSLVLAAFLAAVPIAAGAQEHCSRETLTVRGTPVTIGYCLTAPAQQSGPELLLAVDGTYSSGDKSFSKKATLRFVTGEGPAEMLQNVDLAPLGLTGTLHLTLEYSGGQVTIAAAMLTPGAIIIK